MKLYLGIDLGTTGLKAVLVDEAGAIRAIGYRAYPIDMPAKRRAEQSPEGWWRALCGATREALEASGADASAVAGVGFSGQMHGLVALDAAGAPVYPAIIHCDQRAGAEKAAFLSEHTAAQLGEWTANPVHSGFLALSLRWLKTAEPDAFARIRTVLMPKDYLRYRLTGEMASEATDFCSSLLYDVQNLRVSAPMCDALGVPLSVLPDAAHWPCDLAGTVTPAAAAETGLEAGTPVAYGGGDQPMQALANGLIRPGDASVTVGTSGQVLAPIDSPRYDPALRTHTFVHAVPGQWYAMGAMLNACLAYNWLLEGVLHTDDFKALDRAAADVPAGCGGLLFLPYLTGERTPHLSEVARGAFIGLTLPDGRGALARAVLEGVAYGLRDCLEILTALTPVSRLVASGGGMQSPLWRQIVADVLGRPLYRSGMREQAGCGAAMCAMVGTGRFASIDEACAALTRWADEPVLPDPARVAVYDEGYARYRAAYRANAPLFEAMAKN